MKIASHFTLLVYPFRHVISGEKQNLIFKKLTRQWNPWWRRFDQKKLEKILDDTYFFLPFLRTLLFPETAHLPLGYAQYQVTRAMELANLSVDQLAEKLHTDGMLRITYDPQQLETLHPMQLEFERDNFYAPIRLLWADVALFPQNVGFLILKVQFEEDNTSIDRINDLLYYLRLVHPPKIDWELVNWRCTKKEFPIIFKSRDLVDFLLQGLVEGLGHLDYKFDVFLELLNKNNVYLRYTDSPLAQVYGSAFHQYTYACLDNSSEIVQPKTLSGIQNPLPATKDKSPLFASAVQKALYELATCTVTSNPEYEPHPNNLSKIFEKGHIAIWSNWEAMTLHDNVVFLGTRPSKFTLHDFPNNIENDYFPLYLLTLYQKTRLSLFSGELMRSGADLHRNLHEARSLWDAFIMFRNHYWFVEVTLKPQGNELYRQFQSGLDVLPIYESVSDELQELQEYFERKAERRISTLLNFLTFIGLPAGLLIELFGSALVKEASWLEFGLTSLVVYIIVALSWYLWNRYRKE